MKNIIHIDSEKKIISIILNPTEKDLIGGFLTLIDGNWKHEPSISKIKIFGEQSYLEYVVDRIRILNKDELHRYKNPIKVGYKRLWYFPFIKRAFHYIDTSKIYYLTLNKTTPFDRTYYNYALVFKNN
jgi:hypothetical protein